MEFLSVEHKENYYKLISKLNKERFWKESLPVLYIVSGNRELLYQVNNIYNFKENRPIFVISDDENDKDKITFPRYKWQDWSELTLLKLAVSIYKNEDFVGLCEMFRTLDADNTKLALNVINTFLNRESFEI